jgi:phosphoglycerate dehydrogenase-like enzyme
MSDENRPLIVVPGDDPPQIAGSAHLDRLHEHGDVVLYGSLPTDDDELLKRAKDAVVIVNSRGTVNWRKNVLEQLPKLKMIATCSIGVDCIDLDAAREQGIVVSNIPGRTAPVVAEHALALLLATARRLAFRTSELKAGRWVQKFDTTLYGKTLGVIGTGNIGSAMIRLAKGIGMDVIAWSYHPNEEKAEQLGFRYVDRDELLKTSDAISLHVKLTDDSRGLIGSRELSLMKPGCLLVNTARGALVETDALVEAIQSGHLGGAGLDVFDIEPLPADHPILDCEQVVLTPHSADQTPEGVDLLNGGAVDNAIAFLKGQPQNDVTAAS